MRVMLFERLFETHSVEPFAASQLAPVPPLRTAFLSLYVRGSSR
jgi:hypothetical protein